MNTNCSSNENAPANTTPASDGNDTMSEGARLLIEAMKTEPHEFESGGKYGWIVASMGGIQPPYTRLSSPRDVKALTEAYERYILEPAFTERVVKATLGVKDVLPVGAGRPQVNITNSVLGGPNIYTDNTYQIQLDSFAR